MDDVLVADIEPADRELEVGMRPLAEAEHVDEPVARLRDVGREDQKMLDMRQGHDRSS